MIDKELDCIVRSKMDGYLEAAFEAFPSIKEMFDNTSLKELLRRAAVNGARWFMQSLWHDASEMPDVAKIPLYKDEKPKDAIGAPLRMCTILTDDLRKIEIFSDYLYNEKDWKKHCVDRYCFNKWCFVSDLLPEEFKHQ